MSRESVIVTAFGYDNVIEKIVISTPESINADTYINTINKLELKNNYWVNVKTVYQNTHYFLDEFLPIQFDPIVGRLNDRAIQKVLREVDSLELAKALKGAKQETQEKIFRNISKRAAEMLKEDMEYMGPIRKNDVKETQEKILSIIYHLYDTGEIIIRSPGEEELLV